jgi:drug/metabolite transporter (DMT)-like permease
MNLVTLFLIVTSVFMSACAQILLKLGVVTRPEAQDVGLLSRTIGMLLNPWVLGGLGLYSLGAIVWLFVLSRVDVTYAYPFMGLGFIATMALGVTVLGEQVNTGRLLGTLIVVIGIVCVARS